MVTVFVGYPRDLLILPLSLNLDRDGVIQPTSNIVPPYVYPRAMSLILQIRGINGVIGQSLQKYAAINRQLQS